MSDRAGSSCTGPNKREQREQPVTPEEPLSVEIVEGNIDDLVLTFILGVGRSASAPTKEKGEE